MNISTLLFTTPQEANIHISTYKEHLKDLILQEIANNPTMVLHTDKEICAKYASSIVSMHHGKIMWNASVYPTNMKPLTTLILDWRNVRVGEIWSVIIHPDVRWYGLGSKLISKALQTFANEYDVIVEATVNDIMFVLSIHQWFECIPFPKALYEEGKEHLAPHMKGKEHEFGQKAKCLMYNVSLTHKQKNELIHILTEEYTTT